MCSFLPILLQQGQVSHARPILYTLYRPIACLEHTQLTHHSRGAHGPSGIITSPLLYLHTIHVPPSWCYRFTPGTRICTPTPRPAPGTLARCKPFTQGLTSPRCNPLYTSGPTLQRLLQRALFTPGERYNTRPPPTPVTAPGVNPYTEADGHVTGTGAAGRAAPPLSRSLEPLSRHRRPSGGRTRTLHLRYSNLCLSGWGRAGHGRRPSYWAAKTNPEGQGLAVGRCLQGPTQLLPQRGWPFLQGSFPCCGG